MNQLTALSLSEQIETAFQGKSGKKRIAPGYALGLLLSSLFVLLLPIVYLTIPAAVSWLAWYHLTHYWRMFEAARGIWAIAIVTGIYVLPALVAITLIIAMIRPFGRKQMTGVEPMKLDPEAQPVLAGLIERIRKWVGAPPTRHIYLDTEVNASASLGGGPFSVFRRKLDLMIGLPLISGLTVEQLTGVLAHEFGHFAQGGAMRLTQLVRSTNLWFAQVVHTKDPWELGLLDAARGTDIRVSWVIWACVGAMWAARKILWLFMQAAHLSSMFMMRRMEFDADEREIELVGSRAFIGTMQRIEDLSIGQAYANAYLQIFHRDGKLANDLGSLVHEAFAQIDAEELGRLRELQKGRKAGSYDTHPPTVQRNAAAERLARSGLFHADAPAADLILDYTSFARDVSMYHYEKVLGLRIADQQALRPTRQLIEAADDERRSHLAGMRALRAPFHFFAPPVRTKSDLRVDDLPRNLEEARRRLEELRQAVLETEGKIGERLERVNHRIARMADLEHQVMLVRVAMGDGRLPEDAGERRLYQLDQQVQTSISALREQAERSAEEMRPCVHRVLVAGTLLSNQELDLPAEIRAGLQEDFERKLRALEAIGDLHMELDRASRISMAFDIASALSNQGFGFVLDPNRFYSREALLEAFRTRFAGIAYPYDHQETEISFFQAAVTQQDAPENAVDGFRILSDAFVRTRETQRRLLNDLAVVAETVEDALGFERLPAPSKKQLEANA